MTSTLALLGFMALTFLLLCRASMACHRKNSHHKRQHRVRDFASRETEQESAAIPPEERDVLVPLRQE
jgi:hypothetical protein